MKRKAEKGASEDFKVKKRKLGKAKAKPFNHTNTEIRSRGVILRKQNLRSADTIGSEYVTSRNLSLHDLCQQLKHYSSVVVVGS